MSVVGQSSFIVNTNGMKVPVSGVQWNGNSFSGSGNFLGQSFTGSGTASGSTLTGTLSAVSLLFL